MTDDISSDLLTPPFATKVAIVLRDDLAGWQRMNVTAFLSSGIAAANPELVSEPYRDGDGGTYLPLLGMPVLVFEGSARDLVNARTRAVSRGLRPAIYTHDMFATGHDAANRSTTVNVPAEQLDLGGLAVHGPKNGVDKILKERTCTHKRTRRRAGEGSDTPRRHPSYECSGL